ncbi:adenosylcobinamide amidohydrolase [Streptomyces thermocarboxydus]
MDGGSRAPGDQQRGAGRGIGERAWILNAQVAHGYRRTDPEHLASLAAEAGLSRPGVGLMTAADVSAYARARDAGAEAFVTAGVDVRGWAARPGEGAEAFRSRARSTSWWRSPAVLTDAALVNAVATATEAKVQALVDSGLDCSGTPTDAVCVVSDARPRTGRRTRSPGHGRCGGAAGARRAPGRADAVAAGAVRPSAVRHETPAGGTAPGRSSSPTGQVASRARMGDRCRRTC